MLICVFLHQIEDCPNFRKVFCRQIKFIDIAEFGAFFLVIRTLIQSMHDFPRTTLRSRGDRPFRFFSFLTITLRANQNVTGLALSIFGTGIGQFIGEYMRVSENGYISVSNMLKGYFQNSPFPKGLQDIPVVGGILFGNSFFFYLAVACAVALYWYLNKTRSGLYLRSVGESPATADAAGINVTRYKYLATVIGGGVSAVGGMVYIMTIAGGVWNHEGLSGVGWLAVALVIFCLWRPLGAIWGSVLFGALMILYLRLVIAFIPTQLYKILPYVVTVIVLIISSMRNNKEKQPPASLGLNYFREER